MVCAPGVIDSVHMVGYSVIYPHQEAGRMGGRHLDEPDGPVDVCTL